ncbi:MAG: ferredoxin [Pseudomonas sp.]
MDDRLATKSLPHLLLLLPLELAWIAVTLLSPILLPLAIGSLFWLALFPLCALFNRLRGEVPYRLQQLQFFWIIGLGIAVARAIPPFWLAFCVGAAIMLGGVVALIKIPKRLGWTLAEQTPAPAEVEPSPMISDSRGGSAWGGGEPRLTPEGEPVRTLDVWEIAMGGPLICDYLLPDGSVIFNANPSAQFSSDGRYFVSPMPSRSRWGLLIYDRQQRLLHHCNIDQFWELDEVTDTEVIGRASPLTSDKGCRLSISALLADAQVYTMVALHDLWLPQDFWQGLQADHQSRTLPGPSAAPTLQLHTRIPDSLMALDDPLAPLRYPLGELWLDGTATGLLLRQPTPQVVFGQNGAALVCAGTRDEKSGYWLWQRGQDWRLLDAAWPSLDREPHASAPKLLALEEQHARLQMEWAQPCLEYGDHGPVTSYTYSELELTIGQGALGKPRLGYAAMPQVDLLLPLNDAPLLLQSAALNSGERMTWQPLRSSQAGDLRAYQCRFGSWQLPGEWVLDHRVSDCGQFVALIAFADAPAVLHRAAIAEPRSETLHWLDADLLDVHLQGFIHGQLHLVRLLGRNRYVPVTGPGQGNPERDSHYEQAAPAAAQAYEFAQRHSEWRLFYQQQHAALDNGTWRLL